MRPVLLVDGYNMIGAWPKLVKLKNRGDLEGARARLIHDLLNFSHYRHWTVTLVFDAYGTENPLSYEELLPGFAVCFTAPSQTADSFIEQYSFELLRSGCAKLWVATSDRAQRTLVEAQGAHVLSADLLYQEVQKAKREEEQHHRPSHSRKGRTLADRLDPQTRDQLLKLHQPKKATEK